MHVCIFYYFHTYKLSHLKMVAANVGIEVRFSFGNDRNSEEINFVDEDDFLLENII